MLGEREELVIVVDASVVGVAALDLGRVAVDGDACAGLDLLDARNAGELEEEALVVSLRTPPVLRVAEGELARVLGVARLHDEATAVRRGRA